VRACGKRKSCKFAQRVARRHLLKPKIEEFGQQLARPPDLNAHILKMICVACHKVGYLF